VIVAANNFDARRSSAGETPGSARRPVASASAADVVVGGNVRTGTVEVEVVAGGTAGADRVDDTPHALSAAIESAAAAFTKAPDRLGNRFPRDSITRSYGVLRLPSRSALLPG
jgi:hypothetical protein